MFFIFLIKPKREKKLYQKTLMEKLHKNIVLKQKIKQQKKEYKKILTYLRK